MFTIAKVFFKAGVLAMMEELRDAMISKIIVKFQCACMWYAAMCDYKNRKQQM